MALQEKKQLRAGLIGAHLSHSFSPQIHRALADYEYRLIELERDDVGAFLTGHEFDALNVTAPYKKDVIPYLARLSDTAARIGAVNTIVREQDGSLTGYNTDYEGLTDLIMDLGVPLADKKVLVLGSGGASRTALTVATDMGAKSVVVISRSGEDHYGNLDKHSDAAIIINTTPVGMYPNTKEAPLSLSHFPQLEAVIDLIYNPARTALLQDAAARGIPCRNGLLMLVSQARRAAELFLGTTVSRTLSKKIAANMTKETENIVLIGMPGCGKSTLGKLLAKTLGRTFVDADDALVKEARLPIPEIFRQEGEAGFRKRESKILEALGREKGQVIATGGGCVTVAENYFSLRQNGKILFLDIDPKGLPTDGRPLSSTRSPEVLYRERLPLYKKFADVTITVTRDINENLKRIKEALI
ncbi:MAG: shikimate kinase [Clostridia bacterium]|nr:shikimate kinase [Clostridia bacterium]